MSHVRLSLAPGRPAVVEVDGTAIQDVITGLSLVAYSGQVPVLRAEVIVDVVQAEGEYRVIVPESVYPALVALGWTPPPETRDGDG